jgi:hypothetical protein
MILRFICGGSSASFFFCQRLLFLNERLLVLALAKPNDGETETAPSNLEQFEMTSRIADCPWKQDGIKNILFYGFEPPLGGFDIFTKVHKGVQMGLKCIDESLYPNNCSENLGRGAQGASGYNRYHWRFKDGPKKIWSDLRYFCMTVLMVTVVFLLLKCAPFILPAI